jgi:hypothetical protein
MRSQTNPNLLHRAPAIVGLLVVLLTAVALLAGTTRATPAADREAAAASTQPIYGVNFISSAEDRAPGSGRTSASLEQQYQNGLATGATWNRWPLYWFNVEQGPDSFNWSTQDATIQADLAHGLRLNAILLGTPPFYTTDPAGAASRAVRLPRAGGISLMAPEQATPVGLYEPVFSDGSDILGPGKGINPANKWARFVALAVDRYRPGGVLAQINGWAPGVGVTHWEMWNEPDLLSFWDASVADYARLLKVGYLAAKSTDPTSTVLFGALANNFAKLSYYRDVLDIFAQDEAAATNGFYHDILPTHSYFYAWQSFYHVFRARNTMGDFGLDKPIWLNETGVPAWNDYPGPTWDSASALRGTMTEQAAYTIQSTFYALTAGADAVFHFQLYDGCGNQPQGTDFPPHSGELCDANGDLIGRPGFPCAGDANGLYSNPTDAACFTQHPNPAAPRSNLVAYRILTQYVRDVAPYWRQRPGDKKCLGPGGVEVPPMEWIALYRQSTGERVVGLWTLCGDDETADIQATSPDGTALLVRADGSTQTVVAQNGRYRIDLPRATNRNPFPGQDVNPIYPIGGSPVILIEADDGSGVPTPVPSPTPTRPAYLPENAYLPITTGTP